MASRDVFQQNGNPNGPPVTNIPLSKVNSKDRKGTSASDEKAGLFNRRPRAAETKASKKQENVKVNIMGRIYNAIFNFSIVTRYLLLSFPLGLIIAVPIVLGATVFGQPGRIEAISGVPIVWVFTWVEVVWISLWVSKIAAKLLPRMFVFVAGAVSPGVRKYSLAIKRLEIPLSLVGWALASLATFLPILTHHPNPLNQCPPPDNVTGNCDLGTLAPWTKIVQQVLLGLMVCSLILLGEKAFVQFVSISYHATQYDSRIKASKRSVYLLGILYDASRALFEPFCPEFAEEDYIINDASPMVGRHNRNPSRNISGSATPVRILQNAGRIGDQITAAFGKVAHEVTGKDVFNPTASHSVVVEALENKVSCEALARRIWMSLVVEGKDALYKEDIAEVLADRPPEEAEEAFQAVDRDANGDVSLDEMILTVCEIGRERKAVANSLHNIGSAINVLDNLLLLIVFLASVFVIIAFLNTSFNTLLVSAGTGLLSLSFVFSATAAEVLNSCIFLFVKHPFDVDDRVDISDEQLVVERISLLYTVFRNVQTHKTTQAANSVLNSLWIDNITRSKAMREQLKLYISFDTTLEDVELLRREMQKFVLDRDNCRDFQQDINVEVTGVASMDKMELTVEIKHKSNWANETIRAARRSKFMCALVLALRRVPIYAPGGGSATLGSADAPSYSVSVTNDVAAAARQAFADKKAASHLKAETGVSTSIDSGSSNGSATQARQVPIAVESETSALAMLNNRAPAFDPLSPTLRNPMSPQLESSEESMLRRASTRGKRQSPTDIPPADQLPQYLAAPPMNPQPGRSGQPGSSAPPPTYGNFPQPPPQQQQQLQARPQGPQHLGYSGRSQSPAAGPRYEYPPGQQPPSRGGPPQLVQQPLGQQPPPQQQQGRTSPPRPQPPANGPSYNGGGYSS